MMKHDTKISMKKAIKKYGNPPAILIVETHEVDPGEEFGTAIKKRAKEIGGDAK